MSDLEDLRPLAFSVAYRMLGSVAEAEDVVQEALLRYHEAEGIENPDAFVTTVTTRLAIDTLRSARVRREVYVGSWLPEPLVDDFSAQGRIEVEETISIAFLMLLERLSPDERAVLILREAFEYGFDEIGEIIGKSPANCRQILSRARQHVGRDEHRFETDRGRMEELTGRFLQASAEGSLDGLLELLAEDVVLTGDGGGKARSIAGPMEGAAAVARALQSFAVLADELKIAPERCLVNGSPGIRTLDSAGRLVNVISFEYEGGRIIGINSMLNPDKLAHLGAVSDVGLRPDYSDRGE